MKRAEHHRSIQPVGWLLLLGLVAGCGSNEQIVNETSPANRLTEEGWAAFGERNYQTAKVAFENAAAVDPLYPDAQNGLGWVNVFFGLYGVADGHFRRAIALEQPNQEAEAGHAIVSEIGLDYDEALAASARVLEEDPEFSFSRMRGIDFRDVHLVRARSFVTRGELLEAKAEVDVIDPSNTINPGLETFVDDLLERIEELGIELQDF